MSSAHHTPLRVALVGCGQIADAHLRELRKIETCEVVGVCDRLPELAEQAALRFRVPNCCTELKELIDTARPDIVHITTPVQSHFALAAEALQRGVHVYLEKPFTTDVRQCRELLQIAAECQRFVQVGHDQSYDPIWLQCRDLVAGGALGEVQHIDSILGYPVDGPFGRNVLADQNHWVRGLPGGLFQNTISHPLYKITDFLTDACPEVWAKWFSRNPESTLPTELRVHLTGRSVTANLLFTSTVKPLQRVVRLYGTEAGCEVDFDCQTIRMFRSPSLPGAFAKLECAARTLWESAGNASRIVSRFIRSDLHYFAGMEELFRRFQHAVRTGGAPPIPPAEIERVTLLMDRIFAACDDQRPPVPLRSMSQTIPEAGDSPTDSRSHSCSRSHKAVDAIAEGASS